MPIILVLTFNHFFVEQKRLIQKKINNYLPILNMLILGILSFIFIGSSYLKNDLRSFSRIEWLVVAFLAFFQDFGVYIISKYFNFDVAYQTIVSMKNVAFIGTFALIFFPSALMPTISVLVVHFFLIIYFTLTHQKRSQLIN